MLMTGTQSSQPQNNKNLYDFSQETINEVLAHCSQLLAFLAEEENLEKWKNNGEPPRYTIMLACVFEEYQRRKFYSFLDITQKAKIARQDRANASKFL